MTCSRSPARRLRRPALLAGLLAAAAIGAHARGAGDPEPPPRALALVVGIVEYPKDLHRDEGFPILQGAVRDARLVKDLLVTRFGFDEREVRLLLDADATHENIVRAFHDHLIARAGPDTECVFWFSGHGSQVPDRSGREARRRDASLIAVDSRIDADGEYDLVDDELRSLVDALAARTSRVLIVTDACHSGGATRGSLAVRSAPPGSKAFSDARVRGFWPADVPLLDDDAPVTARPGVVAIHACTEDQTAYEWYLDRRAPGQVHGALTWALCDALGRANPGDTWRSVAGRAATWIRTHVPEQTPWREGALDRVVFGGEFRAPPPGHPARLRPGSRLLDVEAGSVHGLRPQTRLVLARADGSPVGEATVTSVTLATAAAQWSGSPPATARAGELFAIPDPASRACEPLPVHVADKDLGALLAKRFPTLLAPAAPGTAAYRIEMDPPYPATPSAVVLRTHDGVVAGRADLPVGGRGGWREQLADRLLPILGEERTHQDVLALALLPGSLPLEASFRTPTEAETRAEDYAVTVQAAGGGDPASATAWRALAPADPVGTRGALVMLEVTNPHRDALFVCILSASEDRHRNPIHPVEGARDQVLPGGGTLTIPIHVGVDPRARLTRPMLDRYLLIATREPLDVYALCNQVTMRGPLDELPPVLARAFLGRATRGEPTDPSVGVTTVDLLVPVDYAYPEATAREP